MGVDIVLFLCEKETEIRKITRVTVNPSYDSIDSVHFTCNSITSCDNGFAIYSVLIVNYFFLAGAAAAFALSAPGAAVGSSAATPRAPYANGSIPIDHTRPRKHQ